MLMCSAVRQPQGLDLEWIVPNWGQVHGRVLLRFRTGPDLPLRVTEFPADPADQLNSVMSEA